MSHPVRWLRYGTAFGLSLFVLLGMSVGVSVRARDDSRTRQIADIEKKIAELNKQLAELKNGGKTEGRKPLELKDIENWRRIGRAVLSRDGRWFACALVQAKGKGETVVRQTQGDKEYRFPGGGGFAGTLAFSHDSRWLAFTVMPQGPAGGRRPTQPSAAPPVSLAGRESPKVVLVNLANGDKVEYENAARFAFSGEASTTLAVLRSPPRPEAIGRPATPPTGAPATPRSRGNDLILRDLASGRELTLGNVAEFAFDKKGDWLAMTIDTQGQPGNGVQLRNMKTAALHQLDSARASYQGLTWAEKGEAVAVLRGALDRVYEDRLYSVLTFTDLAATSPKVVAYDPAKDSAFPKGMAISASRAPSFSEDRGVVFFGIHEPRKKGDKAGPGGLGRGRGKGGDPTKGPAPEGSATAKADEERPDVVIWHGNDERLQSQQQVEAGRDRAFSYLCAYRLADKKFQRLADDNLRDVIVTPKGRYAVGRDDRATRRSSSQNGQRFNDIYVIDVQTGDRHLALKKIRYFIGSSPDGRRLLYYDDGQFHVYDMEAKTSRCISKEAGVSFINTEDDHNIDRPPTRPLGWTKDSSAVLISDNWDIWKLPVAEGQPTNLTGIGRKQGIRYQGRIVLDPEEKGIDLGVPQYFSAYGEWNKKSGFVRLDPKGASLNVLCWDDAGFGGLMKAAEADVFVYTHETNSEFPDYHATDAGFKSARRLTNANPQQSKLLWSAGSMLIDYESTKGGRLQGALFLPANYEKGKKYPTVVYIYEKLSQQKNRYLQPRANGFNPALYTSNGYAVLMPDIKYTVNDPGMSAVWCVLPALEAAIATGVVDRDRVGIQGHSWGGYQTAFLITQTPAFRAAVAGAPLTNLVSMYSSIYWNSGWTNQPIFESSQGRFTAGYWDLMEAYVRNSPVYHARNVKTPLMLLHNDKDGAVDFNQGIEYFNTLRRLNKSVVMLQYKGENHGLVKPANTKDYTVRMREFFDHHLMGKPAPGWLKDGVPHLKLEEHLKERAKGQ